jgi:hypothetical protein
MKLNQLSLNLILLPLACCISARSIAQKTTTDTIKTDSVKIKQLNEVLIKSTKKMIEHKVDRTIVNLAGQVTLQGLDAYELLERMPGVRVTGDGAINLLGKGATVYIDGKPTYLSGNDLVAYLRTLPAPQLAKIELMPNPPAKYDAAGSGGIINIFTRKDRLPGYNAGVNLNAGSGQYRKLNGSVNFNYRVDKLNFFLNAGAGAPKDFEKLTGTRRFTDDQHNILSILDQQSRSEFTREDNNIKLGTDYYVNKHTTFGFIVNLNRNQVKEYGLNTNVMYNANYQPDSSVAVLSRTNSQLKNGSVNLNMAHQFDTLGTELTVDLDRSHFNTKGNQLFTNNSYSPASIPLSDFTIRGELPRQIDIYSAKTDFSKSFNGFQFGTGLKFSRVKTDNVARYFADTGAGEQADYIKSNTFLYTEDITAAYTELGKEYKRFGIKAGLRAEKTRSSGHQLGNALMPDSAFNRSYTNLFPTLFLSWRPDSAGKHQLYLNMGRRIGRPGYDKLNPFLTTLQRYNRESGNPFLSPDFTNNIELSHNYNDQLNTNIYYSQLNNITSQVTSAEDDVYVKRPVNSGNIAIAGAMITYNRNVTKWWNTDISINPERVSLSLAFDGLKVDTTFWAHSVNWFNRLTLSKTLTAEVVVNYGGGTFSGQYASKGTAALRAGIRKQLMAGNMTLGLSGTDLLYTAISRGDIVNVRNSSASYRSSKDSRSVTLSISYRISRNAKENKRLRDRSGVRDEQNRVNTL